MSARKVVQVTTHRCPRCGCTLITDGEHEWCTFVGGRGWKACAYGLDEPKPLGRSEMLNVPLHSELPVLIVRRVANGFVVETPQRGDLAAPANETNVFESGPALAAYLLSWANAHTRA